MDPVKLTHIYSSVRSKSGCTVFLQKDVIMALPRSAEASVRKIEEGDRILLELDLPDKPFTAAAHVSRNGVPVHSFFIGTKDPKQAAVYIGEKLVHHDA